MQEWRCVSVALLVLIVLGGLSTTAKTLRRTLQAVKLPGGFMEIVQEDTCSDGLLRLTCRSLHAFVFVLEAEYQRENNETCGHYVKSVNHLNNLNQVHKVDYNNLNNNNSFSEVKRSAKFREDKSRTKVTVNIELRGNYIIEEKDDENRPVVDLRSSFNRKCSGHHHCRFSISENHPGASKWQPANLHLKYACIPEAAVRRYCNAEVAINEGEAGYIKSPGYPLYYPGEYSCGWTFKTIPGRRVSLIFHDLNIRSPETNGNCVDLIRIQENGETIFESCGTRVGLRITSKSNQVTLNLISSSRLYPARGFLLKYEAIGCPEISPPHGSSISNDTLDSRTFQCHLGSIFPDTRQRSRTLNCQGGRWNESINVVPTCVLATSAGVLKAETENNRLSSFSGENVLGAGIITGGDRIPLNSDFNMENSSPILDFWVPSILIFILFVGNFVILYIIFQYRKRKEFGLDGKEVLSLKQTQDAPQV